MFIFLVDANPLISQWLAKEARCRGEKFYHLPSLASAAYTIADLAPDVLVIDGKTARASAQLFADELESYPALREIPCVSLGERPPEELGALRWVGTIPKPVNPELFASEVAMLMANNKH